MREVQDAGASGSRRASVERSAKGNAVGSPPVRKQKRCRVCGELFTPYLTLQLACGIACAKVYGAANNKALLKRGQKVERAERVKEKRAFRQRVMNLSKLKNLAQREFNKFIRIRDEGKPCISCGETNPPMTVGGQWDCGHYRTRGAAQHLRFDERNAHKQCKSCNGGSGNFSSKRETVDAEYERRLRALLGDAVVDELDNDNRVHHWTREELIAIRKEYHSKWRALLAARGNA